MLAVNSNTFLKVRVSEDIKQNAAALFEELGMSLSEAVRLFLIRSIAEQRLPFDLKSKNEPLIPASDDRRAIGFRKSWKDITP